MGFKIQPSSGTSSTFSGSSKLMLSRMVAQKMEMVQVCSTSLISTSSGCSTGTGLAFGDGAGAVLVQAGAGVKLHPLLGRVFCVALFTCLISCEGGVGQLVLHTHDTFRPAGAFVQLRAGHLRGCRAFFHLPALQPWRVAAVSEQERGQRDQTHRYNDFPFVFFPEHSVTLQQICFAQHIIQHLRDLAALNVLRRVDVQRTTHARSFRCFCTCLSACAIALTSLDVLLLLHPFISSPRKNSREFLRILGNSFSQSRGCFYPPIDLTFTMKPTCGAGVVE